MAIKSKTSLIVPKLVFDHAIAQNTSKLVLKILVVVAMATASWSSSSNAVMLIDLLVATKIYKFVCGEVWSTGFIYSGNRSWRKVWGDELNDHMDGKDRRKEREER
jgi:hypothetical protein